MLPAPVVMLDEGIFIAHDSAELFEQLGSDFTGYFDAKNFNWKRLAGAKVIAIEGQPASDYIDEIARDISIGYLDHNLRVNSVISSYQINNTTFSQRVGSLANRAVLTQTNMNFLLIPVNSAVPESVNVPFVSAFIGTSFTDGT